MIIMKKKSINLYKLLVLLFLLTLSCTQEHKNRVVQERTVNRSIQDHIGTYEANNLEYIETDHGLEVTIKSGAWGSLIVKPKLDDFNFSGFNGFAMDLENQSSGLVKFKMRIDNKGAVDWGNAAVGFSYIDSGDHKECMLRFHRNQEMIDEITAKYPALKFIKMNGDPAGFFKHWMKLDTSKVKLIRLNFFPQKFDQKVIIKSISLIDSHKEKSEFISQENFYPFIDSYGQYKHKNWPGKVFRDEDLLNARIEESLDLEEYTGMPDRNKYGSWTKGPKQKGTGYFRTEKVNGKWWLVDPEGYLFWSNGVTCVSAPNAQTSLKNRAHYYELPEKGDGKGMSNFYGKDRRSSELIYDHARANLMRKYGDNWLNISNELAHKRLKSWGLNTVGMWSDKDLMLMRKTPYTIAIHYGYKSSGDKFPDVFHPKFSKWVGDAIASKKEHFNDPYCIGFFINNELHWKKPQDFAKVLMKEGKDHYGKNAMIKHFKSMITIEKFSSTVGNRFSSWDEVLAFKKVLDLKKFQKEVETFYTVMAERYFRICRDELKKVNPNTLYLGARLHVFRKLAFAASAKYCDVVSLNLYEFSIEHYSRVKADKPFISSEFHFGAYDRGMFGSGLKWASDQQDRANLYKDYVNGALKNKQCVGAHWFQYGPQSFTGRGDGENYQIGMVDIADAPYPELRDAMRDVSEVMYKNRYSSK